MAATAVGTMAARGDGDACPTVATIGAKGMWWLDAPSGMWAGMGRPFTIIPLLLPSMPLAHGAAQAKGGIDI